MAHLQPQADDIEFQPLHGVDPSVKRMFHMQRERGEPTTTARMEVSFTSHEQLSGGAVPCQSPISSIQQQHMARGDIRTSDGNDSSFDAGERTACYGGGNGGANIWRTGNILSGCYNFSAVPQMAIPCPANTPFQAFAQTLPSRVHTTH